MKIQKKMRKIKKRKELEGQNVNQKEEIMFAKCAVRVIFHIQPYIHITNKNIIQIIVQEGEEVDLRKKQMKEKMKKIIIIQQIIHIL
jgi:hypothetical protein